MYSPKVTQRLSEVQNAGGTLMLVFLILFMNKASILNQGRDVLRKTIALP